MEVDYSPFLHVLHDGSIWWPLADAVKLGAGYLPVRDDNRDLTPVLRAKNNRVVADARTLLSEFGSDRYTQAHPRLVERDDDRYVEAHEFLSWLSQYVAMNQTESTIRFPNELARAVREATARPRHQSPVPPVFESLTIALEGWFDKPLSELPETLRKRVDVEFPPVPWDDLSVEQRRGAALDFDYGNDPATTQARQFGWDFFVRQDDLKRQLEHWTRVDAPTASDLALKETRLADLHQKLARMELQKRQARGDYYPTTSSPQGKFTPSGSESPVFQYIAYPKAMNQLATRLNATPEELAAWVWWEPEDGGIAAYLNANELDPPPRFHYPVGAENFDYVAYLMACWFREDELAEFMPADRYITGAALIDRWNRRPGLQARAFIRAKIAESRLMETHPICGQTQASRPDQKDFPPLESGLFPLSQVESIEREDFSEDDQSGLSEGRTAGALPTKRRIEVDETPDAADAAQTSVRHAVRKLESQDLYKRWQAAYRKSKKNHPHQSDVWHSMQIAKLQIAEGRKAETIRKHMKN
jgi:hypothetical protein